MGLLSCDRDGVLCMNPRVSLAVAGGCIVGFDPITVARGITKLPGFSSWAQGTPQPSASYWSEKGVVYQILANGRAMVIGFQTLAAYNVYCGGNPNWGQVPASFYANSPFSVQDFPVVQDIQPNPNLESRTDLLVFAGPNTSSFAKAFMVATGIVSPALGSVPPNIYTLIPWAQVSALPVQTTAGTTTISLAYQALSTAPVMKLGTEILWAGPLTITVAGF